MNLVAKEFVCARDDGRGDEMLHSEAWVLAIHSIREVYVEKKGRWLVRMVTACRTRWHLPRARITVPPLSERWLSDHHAESIKRRTDR